MKGVFYKLVINSCILVGPYFGCFWFSFGLFLVLSQLQYTCIAPSLKARNPLETNSKINSN